MQTPSKAPTTRSPKAKATRQVEVSFEEAARALECDESEAHFNTALGQIVRRKSKPESLPEKTKKPDEKEPAK